MRFMAILTIMMIACVLALVPFVGNYLAAGLCNFASYFGDDTSREFDAAFFKDAKKRKQL